VKTSGATAGPATDPDFTLEGFRRQLEQWKRTGLTGDVLAATPGNDDRITGGGDTEHELRRIRGLIDAMTKEERDCPEVLDKPRRRIAAGAGVPPQDVERFLRQFRQLRGLLKEMAHMSISREGGA
jgi:signal recognition particle subunit SRP54